MAGMPRGKKLADVKLAQNAPDPFKDKTTKDLEQRGNQLLYDIGNRKFTTLVADAEILQFGQELLSLKQELNKRDQEAQKAAADVSRETPLKVVEPEVVIEPKLE